jgi:hypothetical protein
MTPMIFDTHGTITGPDAPKGHIRILWRDGTLYAAKSKDDAWTAETPKPEQVRRNTYTAGEYQIRAAGCKCSCGQVCKMPRRTFLVDA